LIRLRQLQQTELVLDNFLFLHHLTSPFVPRKAACKARARFHGKTSSGSSVRRIGAGATPPKKAGGSSPDGVVALVLYSGGRKTVVVQVFGEKYSACRRDVPALIPFLR
jgi:hypothetical protein